MINGSVMSRADGVEREPDDLPGRRDPGRYRSQSRRDEYTEAMTHVLCCAPPSESHVDWAATISLRRPLRRVPDRSMSLTVIGM